MIRGPVHTMMSPQLFAITDDGCEPLPLPVAVGDFHALFDDLPTGVYSCLRTIEKTRFLRLDAHMARTVRSAKACGIDAEFPERHFRECLDSICAAREDDSIVRFDLLESPISVDGKSTRLVVGFASLPTVPDQLRRQGVRLLIAEELSRPNARVKRTDFVHRRRPLLQRTPEAYDYLMLDENGCILEGTSCNFFALQHKRIITASDGVLEGVTKGFVIDRVIPELGLELISDRLPLAEIQTLTGAFICSSTRGVIPVVRIAEQTIANGEPDAEVLAITECYDRLALKDAATALEDTGIT
jgi:branched-chain amino acid aminotransferase